MYFRQIIGKYGEDLACNYLKDNNYIILDRNFYCRQGEIDIIAKDLTKNELVFFEVKTRSNFKYGNPADGVNLNKRSHLYKACEYYLYKNNIHRLFIRIDVIEVFLMPDNYKINHIKQIF